RSGRRLRRERCRREQHEKEQPRTSLHGPDYSRWPSPSPDPPPSPPIPVPCTSLEPHPCVRVWPGYPYPLGATWTGTGVNFAIFSAHATKVELCLFDAPDATRETERIALPEQTDQVWHGFLPDARPNQIYGYRVHGPYE